MLVCSFYIKKRFCKKGNTTYNLNQEIVSTTDEYEYQFPNFFELLSSFCHESSSFIDDERSRKMFSIQKDSSRMFETDTYRAMSFIIQSGSYGVEADMTDRLTLQISHHRTEDEADIKSFHCIVYIPKDVDGVNISKGILVFQSIATYGVKTITVERLKRYFSNLNITFLTRSVSVEAFLQKLIEKGALNKITFYKNRISANIADSIFISSGREERTYIKPTFKPEYLHKILQVFKKAEEERIVEIPDDADYDDISINFVLGKRQRTVRLRNLDKLSIVEDIPDEIVCKEDDVRLINYMIDTANEYKERIIFEVNNEV